MDKCEDCKEGTNILPFALYISVGKTTDSNILAFPEGTKVPASGSAETRAEVDDRGNITIQVKKKKEAVLDDNFIPIESCTLRFYTPPTPKPSDVIVKYELVNKEQLIITIVEKGVPSHFKKITVNSVEHFF